ncbi:DUF1566 domain-containing protein [Prevotella communis]|uniref:Lcl domain-containing protein n=1 Tax=Prevotella communis TaxID=2913614 RepID=UPI001EDBC350|nr:DUF1566 domain-containing protein [Prevotella communis]UKK67896.1 DUF1566 domain-containing protein [Prevotella communis]UKK69968.1 DUF1566 domain-containing protein [Prevotella communis]
MKTISRYIMTLALLLTAVTGAWAQTPTIYFQQDYATETVDWSTATGGRFTPIVENGYLTVNQNQRNNNGTTLTCTATQGKVDAGKDFTMTFNVKLGASTNQSATAFNIYDAANSAPILSLAEGSVNATAWKINQGTQTATVSAGGGKSLDELSWIFVQVTYIAGENAKTYLTLKDEQNNIIDGFDETEIPTISVAGGLGKMTFVTSRYSANFAIDNVLVSEVVNDAAASEPTIDVTTNAASKQDLFTEASFTMPPFDATVNYMLVRDMQDKANPVAFSGLPSSGNIVVKKGDDGKYQPAEALTIQLIDPLASAEDAKNIIGADGITVKVLVGDDSSLPIEYDHYEPITLEAFLADMKPGYYWIKAEPTDENSPYDGTVYSSQFTVVEKYDLAVKPANDFSKGKVESVTVGSGSVTIDANGKASKTGIDPDTDVKIKAKRGYVIDKVEAKKKAAAEGHALTSAKFGEIVGSDGKAYAADDKDNLPSGVTAVAMICYVSGSHGLALALTDEGKMNWSTAQTTCAAHTPAITGGTWKLASKDEWNSMISAAGSDADLRDGFGFVGGTNMQSSWYWSSTEYEDNSSQAYYYDFYGGYFNVFSKGNAARVRACLAF